MTVKSKTIALLTTIFLTANSHGIVLYSQEGHIATDLKIEVFSFDEVHEEGFIRSPTDSEVLTTSINYSNNTTNPAPGSAVSFGSATLAVQYGSAIGVSSWNGHQPQPHFGHGGTISTITSIAAFTIPDITVEYRGIELADNQIDASLHVTTDLVGYGRHVVDIFADFTGDLPGGSGQIKRVLDAGDETVNISDRVTSFSGFRLPLDELFDLTMQVSVQSLSREYPINIDEVGVKQRSYVNWQVQLGGSPAFILPPGYFANSADGSIVDNFFVGNASSTPTASVSEPSTWLMLTLTPLLGMFRRR